MESQDRKPVSVPDSESQMRLPTFLVIGANKAGTSTLYDHLRQHPKVFMPPVKEPHFFSYFGDVPAEEPMVEDVTPNLRTLDDYARLFDDARPDQEVGEASTGYLCTPVVPPRVRDVLPDVRLIAILRDPAERAWSAWKMFRRRGDESRTDPLSAMKSEPDSRFILNGMYGAALHRWLELFPREQLSVYLLEDLAADANQVMADIFAFLGLTPVSIDADHRENAGPDADPAPEALRNWLVDLYRDDTYIVEELLGRDLSHWRAA